MKTRQTTVLEPVHFDTWVRLSAPEVSFGKYRDGGMELRIEECGVRVGLSFPDLDVLERFLERVKRELARPFDEEARR